MIAERAYDARLTTVILFLLLTLLSMYCSVYLITVQYKA